MTDIEKIVRTPIFFEKNRVGRVYTGGALFAELFGDDSTDGFEPEEWVVSSVVALNKEMKSEKEGVSVVKGTDIYLDDLLKSHKNELLGDRDTFGVLTKFLDSAIRLPVQAHPDKAFSRKHFNSDYGKAESWIVLGTRENACIYFGFKNKMTAEEFGEAVKRSENDKNVMEGLLNRVPVKAGDVFFVPAKMVHAIGAGCLILEIQEPTDFTIQPEYFCGDYRLNEREMYIGLDPDTALTVFDYSIYGERAVEMGRKTPKIVKNEDGVKHEELITYSDTPCFAVERYTVTASKTALTDKPAVYVIVDGEGEIICGENTAKVKKGDYFLLPHLAEETVLVTDNTVTAVACLPPKK